MTLELSGKTAVVTGSSSGIGRAIALELAEAGAAVVIHARANRERATATAAAVSEEGGQSLVVLADISVAAERQRLVEEAWRWRQGVDIWVNNAGADTLTGPATQQTFDQKLETLWRVDVAGTIALSRAVGRRMQEAGQGVIINIGWDQSDWGMAGDSGEMFATAKGAITAFSRSLARSLAPKVRVNVIAPGWIQTAWGAAANEYWQRRATEESLVGRWGQPEDIARAVRFLASPAAEFVNGQTIAVNGGFAGPSHTPPPRPAK